MKELCLAFCFLIHSLFGVVYCQPALAKEGKSLKVAMILWRGETPAERGLKEGLKELGYSVEYVTYDVDQDKERLAEVLRNQILPNVGEFDYVYCFGTTVTKMAKSLLQDKVPLFFNGVTAPVEAELIDSTKVPGGNISGVTNAIDVDQQMGQARKLVPFKKLGVMFNPREKNSMLRAEEVSTLCGKMDFQVVELNVSPERHQLERTLQRLLSKEIDVDAVFIVSDSYLISEAKLIGDKLREAKIPALAAQKESIEGGALLGFVPDYIDLGKMAAQIVDQNQKGRKMGEIPIAASSNPKLVINKKTCDLLGIQLPQEMAKSALIIE